jgi:hypothetical protein
MTEQPEAEPEDSPPFTIALEPDTVPDRPLTVDQLGPLLAKEIG